MQYSDLKTNFQSILNRRDITPSQTNLFMQMAIQRIQRNLRVPAMEVTATFSTDGTGNIPVPGDMLEIISIYTNDAINQNKLERVDLQTAILTSNQIGVPTFYHRNGGNFLIGPVPVAGTTVYINYYQDAGSLVADTDHNWITDAAPDLLMYGALTRSADFFLDDRKQMFEQTYTQIEDDLRQMALQDELINASMTNCFDTDTPYYQNGW